jgi:hypothetical protein
VSPVKKRRQVDSESDSYEAPRKVKRGLRKASESPMKSNQDFEKELKTKET